MSAGTLSGRHALVTGGGRGIGEAIAFALSRAGASVTIAARSRSQIEALASTIGDTGARAHAVTVDVTDEASVAALMSQAQARFGRVDILVNNAGVGFSSLVHKTSLEDWNRVMAVNVTGAFLCTRAVLPAMLEAKWGRIVNVASMAGLEGSRYTAAYTASKHALVGFTRAVAEDIRKSGVTINAVCPAFVDTPMTAETVANVAARTGKSTEEALTMVLETARQVRLIRPEEVADSVLLSCEDSSQALNGRVIVMNGGQLH